MTNPSRSASNGRLAFCGWSLRADSARMLIKPAKITGRMLASVPPATMTSASSRSTVLNASPTAWLPVAHALATAMFGPSAPMAIATSPDAESGKKCGRNIGETRSGPRSSSTCCWLSTRSSPPAAVPKMMPTRSGHWPATSSAASAMASLVATRANFALRSMWRSSLDGMIASGLNCFTSPPILTPKALVSNRVRVSMPEQPASRFDHASGTLLPTGVTAPRPVTTTRRGSGIPDHCDRRRASGRARLFARGRLFSWAQERNDRVIEADRLDIAADAPNQARQHLSRANLDEGVDAIGDHLAYRANPLDRRYHLRGELTTNVLRTGAHLAGNVGHDWHLRIAQRRSIDDLRQARSGLLHQRRM